MDYNLIANSPRVPGQCDACGAALETREDDTEEALAVRLREYRGKNQPGARDLQPRKEYVITVDATPSPEEIQQQIRRRLSLPAHRRPSGDANRRPEPSPHQKPRRPLNPARRPAATGAGRRAT